jgi:hypothetical protein
MAEIETEIPRQGVGGAIGGYATTREPVLETGGVTNIIGKGITAGFTHKNPEPLAKVGLGLQSEINGMTTRTTITERRNWLDGKLAKLVSADKIDSYDAVKFQKSISLHANFKHVTRGNTIFVLNDKGVIVDSYPKPETPEKMPQEITLDRTSIQAQRNQKNFPNTARAMEVQLVDTITNPGMKKQVTDSFLRINTHMDGVTRAIDDAQDSTLLESGLDNQGDLDTREALNVEKVLASIHTWAVGLDGINRKVQAMGGNVVASAPVTVGGEFSSEVLNMVINSKAFNPESIDTIRKSLQETSKYMLESAKNAHELGPSGTRMLEAEATTKTLEAQVNARNAIVELGIPLQTLKDERKAEIVFTYAKIYSILIEKTAAKGMANDMLNKAIHGVYERDFYNDLKNLEKIGTPDAPSGMDIITTIQRLTNSPSLDVSPKAFNAARSVFTMLKNTLDLRDNPSLKNAIDETFNDIFTEKRLKNARKLQPLIDVLKSAIPKGKL